MHLIVIIISSVISIGAYVPYQLDVARGRARPRLATWMVWALLSGVGGFAALADHQLPAAVFGLCTAGSKLLVIILGLRYGEREFRRLDVVCMAGALIGVGLLLILRNPTAAAIAVIVTDFVGTVPTFKHCWQKPYEETMISYALFVTSEWLILLIANYHVFTGYAVPLFDIIEDGALAALVFLSPHWDLKLKTDRRD